MRVANSEPSVLGLGHMVGFVMSCQGPSSMIQSSAWLLLKWHNTVGLLAMKGLCRA